MRRNFIFLMCVLPVFAFGQGVWEKPDVDADGQQNVIQEKAADNPNAKYLAGAVPEVDGRVEWQLDVDVPNKSADQIYDVMLKCLTDLTKTENQLEGSTVALVNKQDRIIVASIREWLVFTDKLLALDRAKLHYTLIAYCKDNHLTVTMNRISYRYESGGTSSKETLYKAEELINDESALNRKKTKMYRGTAKFRRGTIDRKDYLFSVISEAVLK